MDLNLIADASHCLSSLALPVAQLSGWLDASWWWAVLQVVFGLGMVIFVHELGHFLVAKACGVKCDKFYVGFDAFDIKIGDRVLIPRRLLHFQWGETEYGVGILPLGGYVKMLGQDDNPAKMAEERERAMNSAGDGVGGTALDPRSYQAKTVPQRMAIISAGVIMNLIFGVIFAAIAFRSGVNYEPPKVGTTIPGSPAWQNKLDGCEIVEIGDKNTGDEYYSFMHLREQIILDGFDQKLELKIRRPGSQHIELESIATVGNLIGVKGGENLKSLGINPMLGTKLSQEPIVDGQAAERASPPLEAGDVIVAIEGNPISDGFEMKRTLAKYPDKQVTMTVKRMADGKQTAVDIKLPPNPQRHAGFSVQIGPIRAIRRDSPAQLAGLLPGDIIAAIDGQAVGDPFTLQQRMLQRAREKQSVKFQITRFSKSQTEEEKQLEMELELTPVLPEFPYVPHEKMGIAIESVGINLPVRNVVGPVFGNSAVTESSLQTGDRIVKASFELNERQSEIVRYKSLKYPVDFDEMPDSWASFNSLIQQVDPGTVIKLTYERDKTLKTTEVRVALSDDYFQEMRGFFPEIEQRFYKSATVWGSIKTGFRQTIYDASRVLKFLKKLVRGQLSVKHFGGPGTIAAVATSEASQGTSRLLLFLTLLSANLAIINFLPIPVLDGGHMVFLAYEGIFRRPVGEKLQVALTIAGFVFLIALMVTVIGLDIWRFT